MIHRNSNHKSEADKVAQIYKDKAFIHEGTLYSLDIISSKEADRLNHVRPKDAIHWLVGTNASGSAALLTTSDKCLTVVEYAYRKDIRERELTAVPTEPDPRAHPLTMDECEQTEQPQAEVFRIEGKPLPIPASIESDDDLAKPAPKKATKPKVVIPAKPKPEVKKAAKTKKK